MRLVKFIVLICFIVSLGAIFYYVQKLDDESVAVNLNDQLVVSSQGNSLARQVDVDTHSVKSTSTISTLFQDYEARMSGDSLLFVKGNSIVFKEALFKIDVRQILLSDLNENDAPECWVIGLNSNKSTTIRAYEYHSGHINRINFPKLKGSQAFGYVGSDSLFFDKTGIVRQFNYENDPYADLSSGKRACYYQFGKDQSFILKKTLDLE
ncbi:hypothetical protein [Aquirufa sp. 5-AUSEE-100C1]